MVLPWPPAFVDPLSPCRCRCRGGAGLPGAGVGWAALVGCRRRCSVSLRLEGVAGVVEALGGSVSEGPHGLLQGKPWTWGEAQGLGGEARLATDPVWGSASCPLLCWDGRGVETHSLPLERPVCRGCRLGMAVSCTQAVLEPARAVSTSSEAGGSAPSCREGQSHRRQVAELYIGLGGKEIGRAHV